MAHKHKRRGVMAIYAITHTASGKQYIGSTVHLADRWSKHCSELRRNVHPCRPLQNAVNCYGREAFTFTVLEEVVSEQDLIPREQWYLDTYRPAYNVCRVAGSALGRPMRPETRALLSLRLRGRKMSPEQIERMRAARALCAWRHSPETRAKMRAAALARPPRGPEFGRKISVAKKGRPNGRLGFHLSVETRAKQSAAKKGKPNGLLGTKRPTSGPKISAALRGRKLSPEHVEKIRAIVTGRKPSPETVAKRAAALRGRRRSEETRRRISEARKGKPNGWLGKHLSEETKAKLSAIRKGKPSWHLGTKRSAENRERMRAAQLARLAVMREQPKAQMRQVQQLHLFPDVMSEDSGP